MKEFLQHVYWGNSNRTYLLVTGGILLGWLTIRLLKKFILSILKKLSLHSNGKYKLNDILVNVTSRFIFPFLYITIAYYGIEQLNITSKVDQYISLAFAFVTTYFFIRIIIHFVYAIIVHFMEFKGEPPERIRQLSGLLVIINIVIWSIGLLMLISNLGYDITTIITGLGIGGIAIALAAQNILGDVFSYFVIFFDKPFQIGDSVTINGKSGEVEKIGIKTSHIRSVTGELLIMPNAEIVKSTIQNFQDMQQRRITFVIRIPEDTALLQLRKIPDIIRQIIEATPNTTFDRSHLSGLGETSIQFETVYHIKTSSYMDYMNAQQHIYFEILKELKQENIQLSFLNFPTIPVITPKN
ncbi:MAG: mechanosensitive ion channel [Bacteroidetes bacterium]|nr:mechanosensitive ion channel [Bacteroidota bacterium]